MRFSLGFILFLSMAGPAFAGGPYVAVGGEVGNRETQNPTGSFTATALNGRLGYDFGKYFGVEAEGALNLSGSASFEDQSEQSTRQFNEDVKSHYGLFLRGRAPVSERISLFGRAGIGRRYGTYSFRSFGIYQFDGSPYDQTSIRDEGYFYGALGVGAEFQISKDERNAIRADFTRYSVYIGGEDQDLDYARDSIFSLAYVRRF